MKNYPFNKQSKLKKEICNKCFDCIVKNGYLGCAFRSFDNECCGNIFEVIKNYKKSKKSLKKDK